MAAQVTPFRIFCLPAAPCKSVFFATPQLDFSNGSTLYVARVRRALLWKKGKVIHGGSPGPLAPSALVGNSKSPSAGMDRWRQSQGLFTVGGVGGEVAGWPEGIPNEAGQKAKLYKLALFIDPRSGCSG